MRLLISGPRVFHSDERFKAGMLSIPQKPKPKTILCAGAYGVEAMARKYANANKLKYKCITPKWKKHGVMAYHYNHKRLIKAADAALIYTDNLCPFTHALVLECQRRGLPFRTFDVYGFTR